MEDDTAYVSPEDYQRVVASIGPKAAEKWRVKHNVAVGTPPAPENDAMDEEYDDNGELPAIDDTETADVQAEGALPGPSVQRPNLNADAALSAFDRAQQQVSAQIKANIAMLTRAQNNLKARRVGPSDAEKWFAIAAALGKPTRTGSFGESLGNLGEVLTAQQAAKRKAQEEQTALLERYGLQIGNERLRMLQSGATQAGQIYRAQLAAGKKTGPVPRAVVGGDQKLRHSVYGSEISQPPQDAILELQNYLADPNSTEDNKTIARRNFDTQFGYGASEIYGGK